MSNALSFLNFHYGSSRKPSQKTPQFSFTKDQRQKSTTSTTTTTTTTTRMIQPSVEEMKWVFDKFDKNKDGKISLEEYKLAQRTLEKEITEKEVVKAFQMTDSDGDGYVDFKEFMELYKMGGEVKVSDIKSAFQVFDLDGDGKISADELMVILKRLGERYNLKACRQMVKAVDADGDGLIDMDEFMTMMTTNKKLLS